MFEVIQIPILDDNYVYLLHQPQTGIGAVIDPGVSAPILAMAQQKNITIKAIFNTHHHYDHKDGNLEIQAATGCEIYAAARDAHRIPGVTHQVEIGDNIRCHGFNMQVIDCAGHTSGQIAWYAPDEAVLFSGDTIFVMGCGRLFEGTPAQAWDSISRLKSLPPETLIYGAHEYSAANARFCLSLFPNDPAIAAYADEVFALRKENKPTVPSRLAQELAANPFLRADDSAIAAALNMQGRPALEVFTAIRTAKDKG